jgi:hypothetical protein
MSTGKSLWNKSEATSEPIRRCAHFPFRFGREDLRGRRGARRSAVEEKLQNNGSNKPSNFNAGDQRDGQSGYGRSGCDTDVCRLAQPAGRVALVVRVKVAGGKNDKKDGEDGQS